MSIQTDHLIYGAYYSMNYLRSTDILRSPSVDNLFSFSLVPFKAATDSDVQSLTDDTSPVFQAKENHEITKDNYEYMIEQGRCSYVENVYPVGNNDTTYIILDASALTKALKAFPTQWQTTAGPVLITLGVCTGYTGGTEITPLNRDTNLDSVEMKFVFGATPTGASFPAYPTILVGSASTNQTSGGGHAAGRLPIILKDLKYVFKIENNSGEAISLYSDISWFEV